MNRNQRTSLTATMFLFILTIPGCDFGWGGWGESTTNATESTTGTTESSTDTTDGTSGFTTGLPHTTTEVGSDPSDDTVSSTSPDPTDTGDETTLEMTTNESEGSESTDTDTEQTSGTEEPPAGCQKVDILLVVDGSQSMHAERIAVGEKIGDLLTSMASIHQGVDFRLGVTHDHDGGFIAPDCWTHPDPWVDSSTMSQAEMLQAVACAFSAFGASDLAAPQFCEHPLTSAVNLLEADTGFIRNDALLTTLILADEDDYGETDLNNSCGGCGMQVDPDTVETLYGRLVDIKGDPELVASVVIAGDPSGSDASDGCGRSGSCGCDMYGCDVYDGQRLLDFSQLLGSQGGFFDLCGLELEQLVPQLANGLDQIVSPTCASVN